MATNISGRLVVETRSAKETEALGAAVAAALFPGACVALRGDLGSGKTVFARGVVHGLGVPEAVPVTSPTFVIISEYQGRLAVHHIDAYRLKGVKEIVDLGSRELFFGDEVSLVEWAERIEDALPDERLDVAMESTGPDTRRIEVSARGDAYAKVIAALAARGIGTRDTANAQGSEEE